MADQLFRIKPLRWHEAADGYWIASSAHHSYQVDEYRYTVLNSLGGLIHTESCPSIEDGKARAEQHHLRSVVKDLIEVKIKSLIEGK